MKPMENKEHETTRADVYQIVTDRVIELLEAGKVPWHKPWAGTEAQAPRNLVTNKPYRGINVWLLSAAGYGSPYWASFKQIKERGGSVRKGEKSSIAVFWKRLIVTDKETDEKKVIPFLRYYRVFNVEQTEGLDYPKPEVARPKDFNPIAEAERIIAAMPNKPSITHNEARAYYMPALDRVNMPKKELFDAEPEYYGTLFHELVHSTGHATRLGRKVKENEWSAFGSESYSKEELVAEMGASYLNALAGTFHTTAKNSAAYIANWLAALKNDRKMVVHAAAQAQRATDYILGVKHEETSTTTTEGIES